MIVTWEPDLGVLLKLVTALLAEHCPCRIIDNGSSNADALHEAALALHDRGLDVDRLPANIGLAAGLNRGLEQARREAFRYVLMFDQDSAIEAGFVSAMVDARARAAELSERPVAAIGPRLRAPDSGRRTPFLVFDRWWGRRDRVLREGEPYYDTGLLVTSGTLLDLACLRHIGLMREDYFIDNVDLEWCFRATSLGYALVGTDRAVLHHHIGEASDHWLVRRGWLVKHGPRRCYYSTRNRFHLHHQPHAPAGWRWRDRLRFLIKAGWLLLTSSRRREYWHSIRRGLRDAGALS